MVVTLSRMLTVVRLLQYTNAPLSMLLSVFSVIYGDPD